MKKILVLFILLVSMACLTACMRADADPSAATAASGSSDENKMTINMELDKDYDDTEPFVNEALFCVTEDMDDLIAEGILNLDGDSVILEIKNNKTKEVLWSNTWEGNVKSETVSIPLNNLKKDDEYVICLTGRKINNAALEITFDSSFVQERAMPLR